MKKAQHPQHDRPLIEPSAHLEDPAAPPPDTASQCSDKVRCSASSWASPLLFELSLVLFALAIVAGSSVLLLWLLLQVAGPH